MKEEEKDVSVSIILYVPQGGGEQQASKEREMLKGVRKSHLDCRLQPRNCRAMYTMCWEYRVPGAVCSSR